MLAARDFQTTSRFPAHQSLIQFQHLFFEDPVGQRSAFPFSEVIPVDQIHDDLDDDVLVFGPAFRNHEGQSHKSIVSYPLVAVTGIKNAAGIQKPDEQESPDALVTVDKRVVFDYKIEDVGGFLFDAGIDLFAFKRLVDRAQGTFERLILFPSE